MKHDWKAVIISGRQICKCKIVCFIFSAILVFIFPGIIYGNNECYTIIAGKKATFDGSVLLGHNEDDGIKLVAGLRKIERKKYGKKERVFLPGGGSIPQIKETYSYWWLQMPEIEYGDTFINEHGVAVVSNACASREDQPQLSDGGIGSPILRRLVAERAKTARQGVELIGMLIQKFGYSSSGRTLSICDTNEGWMVAMVNGKHWVAARIPDDMVAIIANTYTIREVNLKDFHNFLGSSDLIEYAIFRGWHEPADGPFSFEKAYADRKTRKDIFNTHRQWSGLRHIADKPVPLPESVRLPFAVYPKKLLTVQDLTVILRDHYDDTPYEAGKNMPAHKTLNIFNTGPSRHTFSICAPYTNSSSVFQLRADMPVEIGACWWLALWHPCSSPYIPLYFGMENIPEFGFGSISSGAAPPAFGPACRVFRNLAQWVDEDYSPRIVEIQTGIKSIETNCLEEQKKIEKYFLKKWNKDRKNVGKEMTRYSRDKILQAISQALEVME